jgi:hypothetical protein
MPRHIFVEHPASMQRSHAVQRDQYSLHFGQIMVISSLPDCSDVSTARESDSASFLITGLAAASTRDREVVKPALRSDVPRVREKRLVRRFVEHVQLVFLACSKIPKQKLWNVMLNLRYAVVRHDWSAPCKVTC